MNSTNINSLSNSFNKHGILVPTLYTVVKIDGMKVLSEIHLYAQLFQSVFISSVPIDVQHLLRILGAVLCTLYY